jgi:hypothetical protein
MMQLFFVKKGLFTFLWAEFCFVYFLGYLP